mmetsp:Transcript_13392/g.6543  ORF Transcript_13392/g.6543 Transcript_13392/m.6543 type:complete len:141 (-) Transcript_13392:111-533(-)
MCPGASLAGQVGGELSVVGGGGGVDGLLALPLSLLAVYGGGPLEHGVGTLDAVEFRDGAAPAGLFVGRLRTLPEGLFLPARKCATVVQHERSVLLYLASERGLFFRCLFQGGPFRLLTYVAGPVGRTESDWSVGTDGGMR